MAPPVLTQSDSYGTRFSDYTPSNHQAPLWIATSMSLTYVCIVFIVRVVAKSKFWALDDAVLAVAHVIAMVQWAVMYAALDNGVGKLESATEAHALVSAAKLVFASRILLLLATGCSKLSVILFLRQLFTSQHKKAWRICTTVTAVAITWIVISPLAISVDCSPSHALKAGGAARCPGDITRWRTVASVDVAIELLLTLLPMYLFASVRMSIQRKLTVAGAFSFRIGVPAFFIAYLESYTHFREHGRSSIDSVRSLSLQQALLGYSLIAATTPCLKGFLERFHAENFNDIRDYMHRTSTSTTGSQHPSLAEKKASTQRKNPEQFNLAARVSHEVHAYAAAGESEAGLADGPGIHRRVDWEITPA